MTITEFVTKATGSLKLKGALTLRAPNCTEIFEKEVGLQSYETATLCVVIRVDEAMVTDIGLVTKKEGVVIDERKLKWVVDKIALLEEDLLQCGFVFSFSYNFMKDGEKKFIKSQENRAKIEKTFGIDLSYAMGGVWVTEDSNRTIYKKRQKEIGQTR